MRKICVLILITLFGTGLLTVCLVKRVHAAQESDPRVVEREYIIQAHHWQLAEWGNGSSVCEIYLEHNQVPDYEDVIRFCGYDILQQWLDTPACEEAAAGGTGINCEGLLNRYAGKVRYTEIKEVELARISLELRAVNCEPGIWCESNPVLEVTAHEPIHGYQITQVHVRVGGREKIYAGQDGRFPLPRTSEQGDWLVYWAESDFGDQSEKVTIKYRNYQPNPTSHFYRLDLLGPEWQMTAASGSVLWEIFPPVDRIMMRALDPPLTEDFLYTTNRYILLASHLIQAGIVASDSCPNGGLYTDGSANPCGEMAAADQVLTWQNQYDHQIFQASEKHKIPARLLKGIIAQETQFWPQSNSPYELGLGKITENGADLLLMWNLDYYLETCTEIYRPVECASGYANLHPFRQEILRRAALDTVGTPEEIDTLAALIYASAAQTNQMVRNTTQREPAEIIDYEEMWKITVGNYYIGSGCISVGLKDLAKSSTRYTWNSLVEHMVGDCKNADRYVRQVMDLSD